MTGRAPVLLQSSQWACFVLWKLEKTDMERTKNKHTNWVWKESLNIQSNRPYLVLCSHSHFAPFSSKNMEEEQNRRTPQMCF